MVRLFRVPFILLAEFTQYSAGLWRGAANGQQMIIFAVSLRFPKFYRFNRMQYVFDAIVVRVCSAPLLWRNPVVCVCVCRLHTLHAQRASEHNRCDT